jgi:hypothetical protein
LERIQRPMVPNNATLARLVNCYTKKESKDKEDKTKLPAKLTKIKKVREVLKNINDYLYRTSGSSGLPLAYVVRDQVALLADDPGYGLPSPTEEMIARGPHVGTHYDLDNKAVWQVVRHCTHGGPGWSWVQSHQRVCDGRALYLALKAHYLGEAYSLRIRAAADNTIDSAYFDGKSRSYTFEKYCKVIKSAFTDIEVSGEEISETRKVRVLLHGIRDKRLDTAIAQVMATPALRYTFDSALNFIARFADTSKVLLKAQWAIQYFSNLTESLGEYKTEKHEKKSDNAEKAKFKYLNREQESNEQLLNKNTQITEVKFKCKNANTTASKSEDQSKQNAEKPKNTQGKTDEDDEKENGVTNKSNTEQRKIENKASYDTENKKK